MSIAIVAVLVAVGGYAAWTWRHPLQPGEEIFVLKPGATLRGLAHQLQERGVLREPYTFTWVAYLTGRSRQLKAGEYRFHAGITLGQLLDQVVAGRVIEYPLVFVEGWTFRQMMHELDAAPKLAHTLSGLSPMEVMARLGYAGEHPEGRFFPDTYYYSMGHTDTQVLSRAHERMEALLKVEWERRAPNLPLKNMNEALALASIVEKETGRPEERAMIAAVFINRLRKGMKLQTDPTVIYGMGAAFDGNIRLKDLRRDTPYNTYTRSGLPPTPIAMPGRDAITATLHPADTPALYFVSRGNGTHVFSATLAEHNAAVSKYQLGGRPFPPPAKRNNAVRAPSK
ncbi:MAG: endolytic transglycosylase MltG [Sulfurifustaceae bacterium]